MSATGAERKCLCGPDECLGPDRLREGFTCRQACGYEEQLAAERSRAEQAEREARYFDELQAKYSLQAAQETASRLKWSARAEQAERERDEALARAEESELALGKLRAESMWQPIETAPHATDVLLYIPVGQKRFEAGWASGGERVGQYSSMWLHGHATLWMPIVPPTPAEPKGDTQ